MPEPIAYEDAIDLLDADHKAVKKMFIDYDALCDDEADGADKGALADRICSALTVHTQIEEELFYPQVREALADNALIDEALEEHAEAKEAIAQIEGMKAGSAKYDAAVKKLAEMIDHHVLEEREQIFLQARQAPLDLRGLAVALFERKKQLNKKSSSRAKESK